MDKIFCPSMMCADYNELKNEVIKLNEANIDIFHCDIMDGEFVPNFTMGLMDLKIIRENTDKLVDCHLMIENPSKKIDMFIDLGVDLIYIHSESERYVIKTLEYIKNKGKLAGLAINPDTSIETVKEMLYYADYVLVMTVNPGFAGQKFIESVNNKIKELIRLKEKFNYKIIIDGACSESKIKELSKLGCDGFVLGTSALFGKEKSYTEIIKELHKL